MKNFFKVRLHNLSLNEKEVGGGTKSNKEMESVTMDNHFLAYLSNPIFLLGQSSFDSWGKEKQWIS